VSSDLRIGFIPLNILGIVVINDTLKFHLRNRAAVMGLATVVASLISLPDAAMAQKIGYSRLVSSAGQALQVTIPIDDVKADDLSAIRVRLADQAQWDLVGLKPPAALESMSVNLQSGRSKDSLVAVVRSSGAVNVSVVDILLEITSPSGVQITQIGFVVPGALATGSNVAKSSPKASSASSSVLVKRGDSLFAIAERNLVSGATIYQLLWALYEANPSAFINKNMNLLRAGVSLQIPDAATVLAVNAQMARDQFAEQARAFNALSGSNFVPVQPKLVVPTNTQTGVVKPAEVAPVPKEEVSNKLTLNAQTAADKEADARMAAAKQLQEEKERLAALEQNIKQLKEVAATQVATAPADKPVDQKTETTAAKPADPSIVTKAADATSATKPAETPVKTPDLSPKPDDTKDKAEKKSFSFVIFTTWLMDNMLIVVAAVLAIAALVIAWMMRAAGKRNDQDGDEGDDVSVELDQAVSSYFESIRQEGHIEPKHIYDESADSVKSPEGLPVQSAAGAAMLDKINLDLDPPAQPVKAAKPTVATQGHPSHPPEKLDQGGHL
jgi:pilus assembly protein FimV